MAESVGSLYYEIDLDDKKLRGSLDSSDKLVKGFGDRVSQHWGNAVDASQKFSMAITALAATVGGVISKVTLTAARTETLGVAMAAVAKATGTSTDVLREQEKILKKQGITTQEARNTLTLFMQSQLDVAQASKIARVAQDLAVISGENSSVTTARLTEAIATMNPMLLRQVGIVQNSEEIFDTYGKTIGKTGRDLTETEKKQALLNLILKEGEKVAGTYEASMGTAGKKLGSLSRHVEEAFNTIGNFFLPAFGRAIDATTAFFKAIQKDNLEKWLRMIKENTWVVAVIAGAILGLLVPAIVAATGAFGVFLLTLAPWAALGVVLALLWKDHADKIKAVAAAVSDYLAPKFEALWNTIKDDLIPVLSNLWHNYLKPLVEILGPAVGIGLVWAIGLAIDMANFWIDAFSKVADWINNNKEVVQGLTVIFGALALSMAFNAVVNAFVIAMNTIILITIPQMTASWGVMTGVLTNPIIIPALIIGAALASINTIKGAWNAVYDAANAAANIGNEGQMRALQKQAAAARAMGDTAQVKRIANALAALGGGRAAGGPVTGGIPYMTGERGRELFIPSQNGFILPNKMTEMLMKGMGGKSNNTVVNIGNIEDRQDADYILRRMDQNQILEGRGLSPAI